MGVIGRIWRVVALAQPMLVSLTGYGRNRVMKIDIVWPENDGTGWVVPIRWLVPGRGCAMPGGVECRVMAASLADSPPFTTRQLMARLPGSPEESKG